MTEYTELPPHHIQFFFLCIDQWACQPEQELELWPPKGLEDNLLFPTWSNNILGHKIHSNYTLGMPNEDTKENRWLISSSWITLQHKMLSPIHDLYLFDLMGSPETQSCIWYMNTNYCLFYWRNSLCTCLLPTLIFNFASKIHAKYVIHTTDMHTP